MFSIGFQKMSYKTIVLLLTLFGCTYEVPPTEYNPDYGNAKEAAISAWEMQIGWVSDRCLRRLDMVDIYEPDDISDYCHKDTEPGKYIRGCMRSNETWMAINADLSILGRLQTAVHEYIHHIEYCEYRYQKYWETDGTIEFSGIDEKHYNKAIWGSQNDSVEQTGKKLVAELSKI